MADVATGNVGDTNPQPPPPDASANPIDPNEVPSLNNPIQFAQDDSDSEDQITSRPIRDMVCQRLR